MVLPGGPKAIFQKTLEQKNDAKATEEVREPWQLPEQLLLRLGGSAESRSQTSSPKKELFMHFLIQQTFTDYMR